MNFRHRFSERSEIYLFEWPKKAYSNLPSSVDREFIDHFSGPKVNEFLSFLKYFKIPKPYKFASVSSEKNLIADLTLKENILMNLNCDSLTTTKDNEFNEIITFHKNQFLEELIANFTEADLRPSDASSEAIKCAQLLAAILSDAQFIFLESPEKNLSYKMFTIFIKALKLHCRDNHVNVFISSANPELWIPEAQFYIQRDGQMEFKITEIKKTRDLSPLQSNDSESTGLNFIMPTKPSKKEAA